MIEKLKTHAKQTHDWSIPRWVFYVVGTLGLLALVYGGVQQYRIMRWTRILQSAKNEIARLQSEKKVVEWKVTSKLAKKQIKLSKAKLQELDRKIRDEQSKQEVIKDSVNQMSPSALLKAFKEEGF